MADIKSTKEEELTRYEQYQVKFFLITFIFVLIGLPMLLDRGYLDHPDIHFNAGGWIKVYATIMGNNDAKFMYHNSFHECDIDMISVGSRTSFHFYHPIGSNMTFLFDPQRNLCTTIESGEKYFIAGFVFLMLAGFSCMLSCMFCVAPDPEKRYKNDKVKYSNIQQVQQVQVQPSAPPIEVNAYEVI
jgi:hypothetical protein